MADDDGQTAAILRFELRRPKILTQNDFRRARRDEAVTYRVRVDLDDAQPPIWRRLDLRSDLTLDVLHQVIQVAFDWTDSHLHRFSIGGRPFRDDCQQFLCPYDAEEGEEADDGWPRASDVRLDEVVQDAGDILYYVYDYGDNWELTLRLEDVLPADAESPTAAVVDGERAAPPEDCGHVTDAAGLAEILDDPTYFAADKLNTALRGPYFVLSENGFAHRLIDLVHRLHDTSVGEDLDARMLQLVAEPTTLEPAERTATLRAHQWFLDRAKDGGIQLTAAGYLKPADVLAASKVVPAMGDWIGTRNREANCAPVLRFRESLQSVGLLRKHKGTLVLTRAGVVAQRDSELLWEHLAARLIPSGDDFEAIATILLLMCVGTSSGGGIPLGPATAALNELGWRHSDRRLVQDHELYWLSAVDVLKNVSDEPADRINRRRVSPAAAALARAALRQ
jgi:hypothetical protein